MKNGTSPEQARQEHSELGTVMSRYTLSKKLSQQSIDERMSDRSSSPEAFDPYFRKREYLDACAD